MFFEIMNLSSNPLTLSYATPLIKMTCQCTRWVKLKIKQIIALLEVFFKIFCGRPLLIGVQVILPIVLLILALNLDDILQLFKQNGQKELKLDSSLYPGKPVIVQPKSNESDNLEKLVETHKEIVRCAWEMPLVEAKVKHPGNSHVFGTNFTRWHQAKKKERINVTTYYNRHAVHSHPLAITALLNAAILTTSNYVSKPDVILSKKITWNEIIGILDEDNETTQILAEKNKRKVCALSDDELPLKIVIKPLPLTREDKSAHLERLTTKHCAVQSIITVIALVTATSASAVIPIMIRTTGVKHMLVLSGLSPVAYLLAFWGWNMTLYLTVIAVLYKMPHSDPSMFSRSTLAIIGFGINYLPWVLTVQHLFKSPVKCFFSLFVLQVGIGLVLVGIMTSVDISDNRIKGYLMTFWGITWPSFSLAYAVFFECSRSFKELYCTDRYQHDCEDKCCRDFKPYSHLFDPESDACRPGCYFVGNPISDGYEACFYILLTQGILFILLYFVTQIWIPSIINHLNIRKTPEAPLITWTNEDNRVQQERATVQNLFVWQDYKKHDLVFYRVTKSSKDVSEIPIKELSVMIPKGTCLVFYGQAPTLTSLAKLIVGEIAPTTGAIYINGVAGAEAPIKTKVGYLPRDGGLLDDLTCREMVDLVSSIGDHGLTDYDIDELLLRLELTSYLDTRCGQLRLDEKKKLSLILSLLNNPELIVLDEPTLNVDYKTRVLIWNVLKHLIQRKKTLIVVSTNPEECEKLDSRIAVMAKGHLVSIDKVSSLLNEYGRGYTVTARFQTDMDGISMDQNPFADFILYNYNYADIQETSSATYYHFPDVDFNTSKLLSVFEDGRSQFSIDNYSVELTALKHVLFKLVHTADTEILQSLNAYEDQQSSITTSMV